MKKISSLSLLLFLLVSCTSETDRMTTAPNKPILPSPHQSVKPRDNAETVNPSPSASTPPVASPTDTNLVKETEVETVTPSPIYSPTLSPVPEYLNDCSNTDKTSFKTTRLSGEIIDNEGSKIFSGRVRLRSLDPCRPYDTEVLTDRTGQYSFSNAPYDQHLEIEVSVYDGASAFYQTKPVANPEKKPEINYYPFWVNKKISTECPAIAGSHINVSGKIDASSINLPPDAEAVIHLRSLNGCSGFDEVLKTKDLAYSFDPLTAGGSSQLTLSYNGRPTIVRQIGVSSNKQNLPDVNVHNITIEAFPAALKKLEPIWIPGALYPPAFPEN